MNDDRPAVSPGCRRPLPLYPVHRPAPVAGWFGSIGFDCGLAIRRADDTVVVQIRGTARPAELVDQLRALGVAQLALDSTICRARALGWDEALGAVVFELHRAVVEGVPQDGEVRAAA